MIEVAIWQLIFVLGWSLLGIFFLWSWTAALKREAHMQYIFDLRWDSDMRAIKMWQAAGTDRDLKWPDHTDLSTWLLDQLYNPHTEKPPYTDYAGWLRLMADKGGKGVVDNIDARALGRVADLIRSLEATVEGYRNKGALDIAAAYDEAALWVKGCDLLPATGRAKLSEQIRQMKEE